MSCAVDNHNTSVCVTYMDIIMCKRVANSNTKLPKFHYATQKQKCNSKSIIGKRDRPTVSTL